MSFTLPALGQDHGNEIRIGNFTLTNIAGLVILGLIAGIASGMMTMGGGLIQVSGMMAIFGYGIILVRPVVYLTNIFVFAASAYRNRKHGLFDWHSVSNTIPWVIAGVVIGYILGNQLGDEHLVYIIGVMALLIVIKTLFELLASNNSAQDIKDSKVIRDELGDLLDDLEYDDPGSPNKDKVRIEADWLTGIQSKTLKSSLLGIPVGFFCGMMGITGGVLAVPLQQHLFGASLHRAIINSSILGFFASLTGVIVAMTHGISTGLLSWQTIVGISVIMIPSAYFGGLIGAKLLHIVSLNILKVIYMLIMLVVAIKMFL